MKNIQNIEYAEMKKLEEYLFSVGLLFFRIL